MYLRLAHSPTYRYMKTRMVVYWCQEDVLNKFWRREGAWLTRWRRGGMGDSTVSGRGTQKDHTLATSTGNHLKTESQRFSNPSFD